MGGYIKDDLTDEDIDREAALYGPLTHDVQDLIDLVVRTTADNDTVAAVREHLNAAIKLLNDHADPEPYGIRWGDTGTRRRWGNTVVGLKNAIAPPQTMEVIEPGRMRAEFELGAAYEGPADLVHGGVSALLLDQVLGDTAETYGFPGMTGTLDVKYRRPLPLGRVVVEAWVDRVEGVRTHVLGTISDAEGMCVEAEGIFILPRWARETTPGDVVEAEEAKLEEIRASLPKEAAKSPR